MNLTIPGAVFLVATCVLLPLMAIRSALRVRRPGGTPTRAQYLTSVFVSQGMLLVLALSAARSEFIWLFPRRSFGVTNILLAVAFLVPALGTLPMRWAKKSEESRQRMMWMVPQRTDDLWWWALLALTAGIVEEIVYRGVMFKLWLRILGSWWLAVAVCVLVFALVHYVQGRRAMALIALFAFVFHMIVLVTGDLYTAMAVHFIYDFLAGVMVLRLARRDGVLQESAAG
jgi:membrane protease YdiL (CAAX protease family)